MNEIYSGYENKVVLVTGGAGCVGSNLCKKLAELNAKNVIILDDLSSAYEWNIPNAKNIKFINTLQLNLVLVWMLHTFLLFQT